MARSGRPSQWSCCEWQLVKYGDTDRLGPAQFYSLLDRWHRATGEDPSKFFDIRIDGFRPKNWVGTIGTESAQLEVLPIGASTLDLEAKRTLDRNLTIMVAAAAAKRTIQLPDAFLTSHGGRFEALLATFCELFSRARRKKIIRGYCRERSSTRNVRGRLVFPAQVFQWTKKPGMFVSEWVSLGEDVPENRFLKAVLLSSVSKCGSKLRRLVQEALVQLEKVGEPTFPDSEWRSIRFDRLSAEYTQLLNVGRALLDGFSPGLFTGFTSAASEIIFTASAFEAFVQQEVTAAASAVGLNAITQKRGDYLGKWDSGSHAGKSVFELIPDIQVGLRRNSDCSRSCVLDVKWKSLDIQSLTLGIDSSDIYQLLAYAIRLNHPSAVLVYPWVGPGTPDPDNVITVGHPSKEVRVRLVFVPMTAPGFGSLRVRLADTLLQICPTPQS